MNARLPQTPITADQPLGQIAVELPGSTAVFRRLKLDFCCGGEITLRQAAEEKGLDVQPLVDELSALQRPFAVPAVASVPELVDHIVTRFHDVHRAQLPELIRMARRVEAVHQANAHVPAGLADLLEQMHAELLPHMQKEEEVLFPLLRAGGAGATQPITVLRDEHKEHGAQLEQVALMTNDIVPPAEACNTWRALYAGLNQLRDDLISHIHTENNILFPQFEAQASQGCGCQG